MLFEEAIEANRRAVIKASSPQLRKMLPVLQAAERETARGLKGYLRGVSGDQVFNRFQQRALLGQLRTALDLVQRRLGGAFARDLTAEGTIASARGMRGMRDIANSGIETFGGGVAPLRINEAAILTNARRTAMARFPAVGQGYSTAIQADIRNRLMLGVLREETVDQLTSRLLQSSGLIREFRKRGMVAEGATEQMFKSYRHRAETIAQTELVNAYASVQDRAIREADRQDPGWSKMWDAAYDKRVCPECRRLDRTTVGPKGMFLDPGSAGRIPHPPLHPRCRCCIVPWRSEWPIDGMVN